MEYLSGSVDEAYNCGVSVSMKLGRLAQRHGVTIEVPVEAIQQMVSEELGTAEAAKTVVTINRGHAAHGVCASLGDKERAKRGWEHTSYRHEITLNANRQLARGKSKDVSSTLHHELSHARTDAKLGHEEKIRRSRLRALTIGIPVSQAFYWAALSEFKHDKLPLYWTIAEDVWSATASLGIAFIAVYLSNPDEIHARKHERRTRLTTRPMSIYASKELSRQ